ncbi:MAG: hypothetical protein EPO07_12625 [Verrucomicrobia bacterium]|nr:MAG: hypothetical protein EPO07_12625 [Verrucomicrobiota bacterium]
MNTQIESITPTFPGDILFAVALKVTTPANEAATETIMAPDQFSSVKAELEFRGVPDSPLHE